MKDNKNNMKKKIINYTAVGVFIVFLIISHFIGYQPGRGIGKNLVDFVIDMIKIIPCAFILIGLFDVWVKREHVERHIGSERSIMSFVWAILLASTTVGGLYVAIPLAHALKEKGAASAFVYTYLGAAAICRIPMTLFEASFVGIKFTAIRFGVSLPLVIISASVLGRYLPLKHTHTVAPEATK